MTQMTPTWSDLEIRARYCPHIGALVAAVRSGADPEAALIRTVLQLSRLRAELVDEQMQQRLDGRPQASGW